MQAKEAAGEENLKAGQDFLAANKGEDGVIETTSGLQYRVDQGDGDSPDANDRVTVHYHGTLIDGTVFDSSYDRGQHAFGLNHHLRWTEGLQTMKKGGQTTFFIPSNLAYGPGHGRRHWRQLHLGLQGRASRSGEGGLTPLWKTLIECGPLRRRVYPPRAGDYIGLYRRSNCLKNSHQTIYRGKV